MNYNKEYFDSLLSTILGWKFSGAKNMVLLCIYKNLLKEQSDFARVTINDFICEGHYCRQSIIDALKYLLDRSIIDRKRDVDKKSYCYSIIEYHMEDLEKVKGVMKTYKGKGTGYSQWHEEITEKNCDYRIQYRHIDVNEWNFNDFSYFIEDFTRDYAKKNNIDISELTFIFTSSFRRNQNILNIVDYLNNQSGENYCPLLFKAYIEWYVKYKFEIVMPKFKQVAGQKQYSFGFLKNDSYMKQFLDGHGIDENIGSVANVEHKLKSYKRNLKKQSVENKSVHSLSLQDMDGYYQIGISTLLSECGIVLSGNYLMKYKKKTFQEAADEIGRFLGELNINHARQKKALSEIMNKTCFASPYYETMKFLNWHVLYENVFNQIKNDIDMKCFQITGSQKKNSYKFLVEKEKVEA